MQGDCIAIKTAVSFVDSMWEAFAPLLLPTAAVVLPHHTLLHPPLLLDTLATCGATHFAAVPSLLRLLLPELAARGRRRQAADADADSLPEGTGLQLAPLSSRGATDQPPCPLVTRRWCSPGGQAEEEPVGSGPDLPLAGGRLLRLKVVVSSGEPLPGDLAQALLDALPHGCRLLNLYGATWGSGGVPGRCANAAVTDATNVTAATTGVMTHLTQAGGGAGFERGSPGRVTCLLEKSMLHG